MLARDILTTSLVTLSPPLWDRYSMLARDILTTSLVTLSTSSLG